MRKGLLLALLVPSLFVVTAPSVPAQDTEVDPLVSPNIEFVSTLGNPGVIGARFKGDVMYVTTVSGLTTYNISDPTEPVELGRLPLPHFENEDVDLGGNILLISNDASESTGILYVIDISDPQNPTLRSTFQMGGSPAGGPGHTASCILDCKFAWVTDGGEMKVIDLRDPNAPVDLGNFTLPTGGLAVHDVQVDPNGIAWVAGFNGTAGYKIPSSYNGPGGEKLIARTSVHAESTYDEEFGTGSGNNFNDYIHHNSLRRRGDNVLYITEEDYTRPGCSGAGSFQTWRLPTNDNGAPTGDKLTPLDQWQTEVLGTDFDPDDTGVAAVCSAHYFDLKNNVVAQGWYEQGVRFLDVSDPKKIRQIGYFVPPSAMTWAAYFAPTDPSLQTVYVFDATHGIDVLRIARPAKGPLSAPHVSCRTEACRDNNTLRARKAPIRSSWVGEGSTVGVPDDPFGFACRLGLADEIAQLKIR